MKSAIYSRAVFSAFEIRLWEARRRFKPTSKLARPASMPSSWKTATNQMTPSKRPTRRAPAHSWTTRVQLTPANSLTWSWSTCSDTVTNWRLIRRLKITKTKSCSNHSSLAPRQRIDSSYSTWMRHLLQQSSKDTFHQGLSRLSNSLSRGRKFKWDFARTCKIFSRNLFSGTKS